MKIQLKKYIQYHGSLETAGKLTKPARDSSCPCSTPRSSVFSLAMQLVIHDDCLNSEMLDRLTTIIVDQFTDSLDLPAMGHLEKLTSFFLRQEEYCKATLSREQSSSCCTENSLQHLGSLIALYDPSIYVYCWPIRTI